MSSTLDNIEDAGAVLSNSAVDPSEKKTQGIKNLPKRERDRPWTPDVVRKRIQASRITECLILHVRGRRKMSASQVTAGIALLRKIVPDLQAVEIKGDITHNVVRTEPLAASDWASRHGETIEGEAVEVDASDCIDSESTD